MKTKINFALLSILFIFSILGCDSRFNEQVMYGTVGSKLEKIAPGEVKLNSVSTGNRIVELSWINPTDKDLYGVKITITATNPDAKLPDPISFSAQNPEDIPSKFTFYELTNDIDYSFLFQTYDKNLNYSSGTGITAKPSKGSDIVNVENAKAFSGNGLVQLVWDNKDFATLHEIKITCREFDKKTNEQTSDVTTISLPKDPNSGIIPSSYTFYNLNNGKGYDFRIYQYDKELNQSSGVGVLGYPEISANINEVIIKEIDNQDSSVQLTWENPVSDNFYGIQIIATANDNSASLGNLSSPVYFLKKENSSIPNSFTAIGLDNNKTYTFFIYTVDNYLTLSTGRSINGKPAPTSNKQEVQNFKAVPGNGYIDLFWKLPEDTSLLEKYELIISPGLHNIPLTDISQTSYRATGLTNGTSYSFTLRTIDISGNYSKGSATEARPDTGSSGIFDHPDLFRYKNICYAYDFGYCFEPTEKSFTFTSVTQMNLTKNPVSFVMGTSEVYSVVSAKNITGDSYGQTQVNPGDEFEIVIRYNPKNYDGTQTTASWDEANVIIGNTPANTIRLIGSNYPQPKSISTSKNKLKIWLRSDLIQNSDLTDSKKVKSLPDYSGNNFNAVCTDNTFDKAPAYRSSDSQFNNLPCIDFSNNNSYNAQLQQQTQLIATGSSGNPIITGTEGSTTFVVYNLGISTLHYYSDQTIISANYGTSWPVLRNLSRYYNAQHGWYVTNDYKLGLAVRGSGMAGTWRWACISNETENNPYNRMLLTGAHPDATNLKGEKINITNDTIGSKTLSSCLIYDRTISPSTLTENLPSNIRMFVNGEERFLGYIDSQSSTYTESYLKNTYGTPEEPLLSKSNKYTTVGCYGYPYGDGKGGRSDSLTNVLNPKTTTSSSYSEWYEATKNNSIRPYDKAMTYNSAKGVGGNVAGTSTDAKTTQADYFENWLPQDIWRNGTINTLTLGADFNNVSYSYSRIAEVFIFEGALSDEDIKTMNNYIKYRYNTSDISTNVSDYN